MNFCSNQFLARGYSKITNCGLETVEGGGGCCGCVHSQGTLRVKSLQEHVLKREVVSGLE